MNRPSGWAENDFFQKIRTFGNTAKAQNICAECTIELAKDESITSISYRKSTAGVRNKKKSVIKVSSYSSIEIEGLFHI